MSSDRLVRVQNPGNFASRENIDGAAGSVWSLFVAMQNYIALGNKKRFFQALRIQKAIVLHLEFREQRFEEVFNKIEELASEQFEQLDLSVLEDALCALSQRAK